MTFRRRTVLLAAGAVATAIVLASVIAYLVTRNELQGQVDESLRQTAGSAQLLRGPPAAQLAKDERERQRILREFTLPVAPHGASVKTLEAGGYSLPGSSSGGPPAGFLNSEAVHTARIPKTVKKSASVQIQSQPGSPSDVIYTSNGHTTKLLLSPRLGALPVYGQFISSGKVLKSEAGSSPLPITAATRAVEEGRQASFFNDANVSGVPTRMLTERFNAAGSRHNEVVHGVLQAAVSLTDVNAALSHLRLVLALVCLGGVGLAAVLGLLVSRAALVPVRRLTHAAERVALTQNLAHRIDASEHDELGRLAGSFNMMLAALERSRLAQRQLVSDASHELRTPLTSIRANLDALALGERLPAPRRAGVLAAAQAQLRELSVLVGDLVDLSKTEVDRIELEDVRLDLAAAGAVERARLHAPECRFELTAEPCLVRVAPARLDRAIANMLDNAAKWGPPAGLVEVDVRDGKVAVRDHGPGIDPEDLPRVFDRFYRAPGARGRPGSGLGLAIVRQVAESHGGAVHAANDPGGGAVLTLELAPLQMTDADTQGTTDG